MASTDAPVPHGRQTFHLKSWRDLVSKLTFEIEEFERTRLLDSQAEFRTFRAINAAVTAWHIGDWFWEWVSTDRRDLIPGIAKYLGVTIADGFITDNSRVFSILSKGMAQRNRALSICRTISNAYKHSRSDRFPDSLTTHPVHVLQLVPNSNRATGESYFDLRVFADDAVVDMTDVLKQAAAAWTELFRSAGLWSARAGWTV